MFSDDGNARPASPDRGGQLVDAHRDRALRRSEIRHLLGGGIAGGRPRRGNGADDVRAVHHIDLVALAFLVERNIDAIGPDAAEASAPTPCDGEIAAAIARARDLNGRLRHAADSLRGEGRLLPGGIGDIERLRSPAIEAGGEGFGGLAVNLGDRLVQQNHRRA